MSNSCKLVPNAPNGEPSDLFQGLVKLLGNRESAKLIYAFTRTEAIREQLKDLQTDAKGDFLYEDVNALFDLESLAGKSAKEIDKAVKGGIIARNGSPQVYESAYTALERANGYNADAEDNIAVVEKNERGDYETRLEKKSPQTMAVADKNEKRLELNKALIELLHRIGFDVDFVKDPGYRGIFDPLLAEDNAKTLKTIIRIANNEEGADALPEEVSHLIIAGLKNHPIRKRIDAAFTDQVVRQVLGDGYNQYYKLYQNGHTPVAERLREEAEGKVLAQMLKGENQFAHSINAAPFFRNQLTSANQAELETATQEQVTSRAKQFADWLGLTIENPDSAIGTYLGKSEQSYRFVVRSNDSEKTKLFASLMADLAYEHQDAVIDSVPVEHGGNSTHVTLNKANATAEDIERELDSLGIDGATYIIADGVLHISVNDYNFVEDRYKTPEEIQQEIDNIKKLQDYGYEQFGHGRETSSYLARTDRRNVYQSWLQKNANRRGTALYNACDKALSICTAASEYEGDDAKSERLRIEAANRAATQYDETHPAARRTELNGIKTLFQRFWNWAKSLFRKLTETDVDNAIANAQNILSPIAAQIRSGEIEEILDRNAILAHEKMYATQAQTEKLLDIAQDGLTVLSKRLAILKARNPNQDFRAPTQEIKKVNARIEETKYGAACYSSLLAISDDIRKLMTDGENMGRVYNNTDDLNTISAEADLVSRMSAAVAGYRPYLETLARLKTIADAGEIELGPEWTEPIAQLAKEYLHHLSDLERDLKHYRFAVLKQLISLYYGDHGNKPSGFVESDKVKWQSVDMILREAESDIGVLDTSVFSAGDSRNPLINVVHKIVISQQTKRNNKINKICARLQQAEVDLQKAGHDNKFIYQMDKDGKPTGYFVAPVDMAKYEADRQAFVDSIMANDSIDDYEKEMAIRRWETQHTEEIEVGPEREDHSRWVEVIPRRDLYANPNFQKGWTAAQKKYYETVINTKVEMDAMLPANASHLYAAPQVRKSISQMFDKDGRGAVGTFWSQWKGQMGVVADNTDYGENAQAFEEAQQGKKGDKAIVQTDFAGREIKRVPLYYIHKLEDPRDLSTDGTHAMMSYVTMAVNYSEMGLLANAMNLLKEHVSEDYVVNQDRGGKKLYDLFKSPLGIFFNRYQKKGDSTRIAQRLSRFIDRNVFNETKDIIGDFTIPFTKKTISGDALANLYMRWTSTARIGLNTLSGITNITQGETQMLEEAITGRHFGIKDLAWSKKEYNKLLLGYLADFNSVDRHDKLYMLINQFNSSEDFFRDMQDKDFNASAGKRILGRGNIYFLNSIGEHYLHSSGMLMILNHEKVRRASSPSKEVPLYECIKQVHDKDGWHLELDSDIIFSDKNKAFLQGIAANEDGTVTVKANNKDKLFENLSIYIQQVNAAMHGGYSEVEKGNINASFLGRLVLQFRQWMFGMYNKEFARPYYDARTNAMKEGCYYTLWKFIMGVAQDWKNVSIKTILGGHNLSMDERKNVKVALAQSAIFLVLAFLAHGMSGWKDEDDRKKRLIAYSTLRLKTETGALTPVAGVSFFQNIFTLIKSPAAGVDMLETLSDIFDLTTAFQKIKSGRYKGWYKGAKALYSTTPIYNIQKVIDMHDYNYMFNVFNH